MKKKGLNFFNWLYFLKILMSEFLLCSNNRMSGHSTLRQWERLWEVDFLRGVAVVMMLVSNLLFDLSFFVRIPIGQSWFRICFARTTAGIFILLVGVSLTLSYANTDKEKRAFGKYLKRGLRMFCFGMVVTIATWIIVRDNLVLFGVLHLIGTSIVLAYPFLRKKYLNLIVGLLIIGSGIIIDKITTNFSWFFWLGLRRPDFHSVDHAPLFPWFGVVLVGIFLGNMLFPAGQRKIVVADISCFPLVRFLRFLGRNSLLIYFIHQPLFLSCIFAISPV